MTRKPSAAARGYGSVHRAARERWKRVVNAGQAVCARCGLPIAAGAAFHLDHADDRNGYIGVSHPACNVTAGARKGAAVTNAQRSKPEPTVTAWSRCWVTDGKKPCGEGRCPACRGLMEFPT